MDKENKYFGVQNKQFQGFYRKLPTSPGSPYPSFSLDANEALKVTIRMIIKIMMMMIIFISKQHR